MRFEMREDRQSRPGREPARGLRLGLANYAAFALGVVAIISGYALLDRGSVSAAPLLLFAGYAVCLPAGLLLGWRRLGGRGGGRTSESRGE